MDNLSYRYHRFPSIVIQRKNRIQASRFLNRYCVPGLCGESTLLSRAFKTFINTICQHQTSERQEKPTFSMRTVTHGVQ